MAIARVLSGLAMPISGLTSAFLVVTLLISEASAETADHILHTGQIITVDADFQVVEALATANGRVLAVGSNEEVLRLRGPSTRVTDLKGSTVLPGLIDSHQHTLSAAVSEADHAIPPIRDMDELASFIEARSKEVPVGEWIWVRNVFPTRLLEQRLPTRSELDAAAPNHPVIFAPFVISPLASLNTAALLALGVDRQFAEAHAQDILRDAESGEPTGLIRNHRKYIEDIGTPDLTDDVQRKASYQGMMRNYNAVGLTTVTDRNTFPEVMDFYRDMADSGLATVRISLFHALNTGSNVPIEEIEKEISRIGNLPLKRDPQALVQLVGVKTFADGGILSGSAYMLEPWGASDVHAISDTEYRGKLFLQSARLQAMMGAALRAELQFTAHAVGDGAVTEVVNAFEAVNRSLPVKGSRSSVTHSNFVSPSVIQKMAEMDIVADIQPAWFYLDSAALLRQFGEERLRYFQPLSSLYAAGVVVAGGSDHWSMDESRDAVNPFNPFLSMWVTISRQPRYVDRPLYPAEALSRRQAVEMFSMNAAYALSREGELGSLEPGKFADFIVIDRNVLTCALEDLPETRVMQTYLAGDLVYDAGRDM
jgi:predicted amidohydrolase YtcJ